MYDISQSYYPMVLEIRDTAVELNESLEVFNSRVVLTEIPDTFMKVYISGYVEIEESKIPKQGEFVVDYKTGIITMGGSVPDNTVVVASYYGRGIIQYPAQRIYSHNPNPEVAGSLQRILDRGEEAITELNFAGDIAKRQNHASNSSFFGNQDWTRLVYGKVGAGNILYNSTVKGVEVFGDAMFKINIRIPIDPESKYWVRAKVRKVVGDGRFYLGAVSLDNNYQEVNTDQSRLYNYFGASSKTITSGNTEVVEGYISGYNTTAGTSANKFDPEANYFDLVIYANYQTTADISKTVIEWLEIYRSPKSMHVQDNGSFGGALVVQGKTDMYSELDMNNNPIKEVMQVDGQFGNIAKSVDEWLRINDGGGHTNGVFFGNSLVRTDGNFHIGSNGSILNVTSTLLNFKNLFSVDATKAIINTPSVGITGDVDIDKTLNVDGNTSIGGSLTVRVGNGFSVNDGQSILKATTGATTLVVYQEASTGFLTKMGTVADADIFTINKNGNIASKGSINLIGSATIGQSLSVNGHSYIKNALDVTGATILKSTLDVTGDTQITGKVWVGRNTTYGTVPAYTLTIGDADSGINWSGDGVLEIISDGQIVADYRATMFNINKKLNAKASLSVTGTINSTSNLTVGGNGNISGLLSVGGTLDVTGQSTLSGGLGVTGDTFTSGKLGFSPTVYFINDTSRIMTPNALRVDGQIYAYGGRVSFGTLSDTNIYRRIADVLKTDNAFEVAKTLSVTGNTTIGGTLTATGATTLSSTLKVVGSADLDSNLNVDGGITVVGGVTIGGASNINNYLWVRRNSTSPSLFVTQQGTGRIVEFRQGLTDGVVKANIDNDGSFGTLANISAGGTLSVTGNASLLSNLTVGGTLGLTGAMTLGGQVNLNNNMIVADGFAIRPATPEGATLGTPEFPFQDVYIGANSLYVDGKKVVSSQADTIDISTDIDQHMSINTSGLGTTRLASGKEVVVYSGQLVTVQSGGNLTALSSGLVSLKSDVNGSGIELVSQSALGNINITSGNRIEFSATGDISFLQRPKFNGSTMVTFADTISASKIVQSSSLRFVTDADKANWNGKVNRAGDTMTGFLTLHADPTQPLHAVTKQYVDAVKQSLDIKESVKVATTANITLSGGQTVDGVTLNIGDRVLVKNQTDAIQNGIWVVQSGAWTRPLDFDQDSDVTSGAFVFVEQGTQFANMGFVLVTDGAINIGVTPINFTQFSGAGQVINGTGLYKSGNEIGLTNTVTAGTYKSVTVNAQGRVTAGTNPTTLAGYGITDAISTSGGTIDGNLIIDTDDHNQGLYITRRGTMNDEYMKMSMWDSDMTFHYNNDEVASKFVWVLENTDMEGGTGLNASMNQLTFSGSKAGGVLEINGNRVFHEGFMGAGSGLDADKVDGLQASQFMRSDVNTTTAGILTAKRLVGKENGFTVTIPAGQSEVTLTHNFGNVNYKVALGINTVSRHAGWKNKLANTVVIEIDDVFTSDLAIDVILMPI